MPHPFRRTISLAVAALTVVAFGLAVAGCGGSDHFNDERGHIVRTVFVAPGAVVEARATIGVDTPQRTVVLEAHADASIAEVVSIDGSRLVIRGVAAGETALEVVASLESAELRPRPLDVTLRVVVAEPPTIDEVIGTWRNDGPPSRVPFWLDLRADGTFTVVLSERRGDAPFDEGTWSLDGHALTIVSDDAEEDVTHVRIVDGRLELTRFPFVETMDYLDYAMTRAD